MTYFEPSLRRKRTAKKVPWVAYLLIATALITILHYTVVPQIVLAEETAMYYYPSDDRPKQNDYYCELIRNKGVPVEASMSQVAALCAQYGIEI